MSEKMGVLGTMMAGVAHEINTPIGAVKAAAENLHSNLPLLIPKLPQFFAKLTADDLELFFRFVDVVMKAEPIGSVAEERQIRKNVALALEAMNVAKADTLARTLSKIGVYKQLNDFDVLFKHPSAEEIVEMAGALGKMRLNTDNILTAVGKTQKIIFALRSFSHQNPSVEMIPSKIESQIPIALTLYHNTLKQGVQVFTEFEADLPEIYCFPDELDQVWINLITNAVHAMNNKGELRIRVYQEQDYIKVSITDTGPGIPQDILPRIFEPFFTTKPQGEGTGLGLHICKQIIDKHQGLISVESVPGNTTFTVCLPIRTTPSQGFRAPNS
jgi:signal transduction histidine kinase